MPTGPLTIDVRTVGTRLSGYRRATRWAAPLLLASAHGTRKMDTPPAAQSAELPLLHVGAAGNGLLACEAKWNYAVFRGRRVKLSKNCEALGLFFFYAKPIGEKAYQLALMFSPRLWRTA